MSDPALSLYALLIVFLLSYGASFAVLYLLLIRVFPLLAKLKSLALAEQRKFLKHLFDTVGPLSLIAIMLLSPILVSETLIRLGAVPSAGGGLHLWGILLGTFTAINVASNPSSFGNRAQGAGSLSLSSYVLAHMGYSAIVAVAGAELAMHAGDGEMGPILLVVAIVQLLGGAAIYRLWSRVGQPTLS